MSSYLRKFIADCKHPVHKWGYFFILPGIIWYILFMAYPMYYAISLSFHWWVEPGQKPVFIGIQNYKEILSQSVFLKTFRNTFYFTFMSVTLTTFSALLVAFFLTKITKFRGIFRTMYFLPTTCGVVAVGIAWTWCYEPTFGAFNYFLRMINLAPQRWTKDPQVALFCIAIVHSWMKFGFNVIVYLAGLLSIPVVYYDASKVDGANAFQRFRNITLPLVMPITTLLLVLNTMAALQVFGEVFVLTGGGPGDATTTVAFLMYRTAFRYSKMGKACGIAITLFVVILIVTIIQMRYLEKGTKVEY